MKTKPNNKILFHGSIIIFLIILLLFYIDNRTLKYILVCYIFINILFNRKSHVKLSANKLVIYKNILFIIPTFRSKIKLKDIRKISIINNKDEHHKHFIIYPEFEASVITRLITGDQFYKPDNILILNLHKNKKLEFSINSNKKSLIKIITHVQSDINSNKQSYGSK